MKINISREDDRVFKAVNGKNAGQVIDGDAKFGLRPMESLLNALASCAALDLVHILKKQKQDLSSLDIEVTGTRPDEGYPTPFRQINIHFKLSGHLNENKVKRAVELSVEKYCSVGASLDENIDINYQITITQLA